MQSIDEARLESDLVYRYEYLSEFIGFTPDDARRIQSSAPHIGPRIPELVQKTYEKILAYDATARHLVPPQHGFEGETPTDLAALSLTHPQVQFRKDHLNRYFAQLIGSTLDSSIVKYLDMVGKIHTAGAGNKEIRVPLVQMNALLGLISDVLTGALIDSPLDAEQTVAAVRSFQKLMWIQNDFVNRHFAEGAPDVA